MEDHKGTVTDKAIGTPQGGAMARRAKRFGVQARRLEDPESFTALGGHPLSVPFLKAIGI
jgi:hypothetical protein